MWQEYDTSSTGYMMANAGYKGPIQTITFVQIRFIGSSLDNVMSGMLINQALIDKLPGFQFVIFASDFGSSNSSLF